MSPGQLPLPSRIYGDDRTADVDDSGPTTFDMLWEHVVPGGMAALETFCDTLGENSEAVSFVATESEGDAFCSLPAAVFGVRERAGGVRHGSFVGFGAAVVRRTLDDLDSELADTDWEQQREEGEFTPAPSSQMVSGPFDMRRHQSPASARRFLWREADFGRLRQASAALVGQLGEQVACPSYFPLNPGQISAAKGVSVPESHAYHCDLEVALPGRGL